MFIPLHLIERMLVCSWERFGVWRIVVYWRQVLRNTDSANLQNQKRITGKRRCCGVRGCLFQAHYRVGVKQTGG